MAGRLTLLLTSPRVAPGLLSRAAWVALSEAGLVVGYADEPQALAVRESGIAVTDVADLAEVGELEVPVAGIGRLLVDRAQGIHGRPGQLVPDPEGSLVVWLGSSDGDPGLTDVVAAEVTRRTGAPEVEVLLGSHDVPGSRLLDLVAVMDRLRSPGGCPWDAEQTHESLVSYLIEEAYEAAQALESGDRRHMVEELGDVLLQVAFHARVGEENLDDPFDIDDVAAAIVAKLVRRHPHVFADASASSASEVESSWEAIKAAERAERGEVPGAVGADLLHGIPVAMPPLARATKIVGRLRRAGRADLLGPDWTDREESDPGVHLLQLVAYLEAKGVDPDSALREALRTVEARLGERVAPPDDDG
ncbi:MazG family protein [Lapillicoccus sp.]|uniref:MazG family protein n=1 Tax=Lapillicoccus sp. TaxID=1909287 RepID=UPI003262F235